jgi:Flp pilus assembly protein TadB
MSLAFAGAIGAALAVTAALLAPAFPRGMRAHIVHPETDSLHDAAWARATWVWEACRAGAIAAAVAVSLATGVPLVIAALVGGVAPSVVLRLRVGTARRRARSATTRILRLAEAALRSNATLPQALRRAVDACDDALAARPFARILRAYDLGARLEDALDADARRIEDGWIRVACQTLAIGARSRLPPSRAAALVAAAADRLAFADRVDEEVRARTSGVRVQMAILAAIVPALALYLAFTVPALGTTLAAPLGRFVLVPAALALEAVGMFASWHVARVALR